ncbi:MAG: rhomboid family intramembrane serine protease [Marinifilaceae bacterium]|jgi:membrane associated rhomboid family serine protease|nr:rhomboid family intramembrane serine protease [Marinifilaceae bacterium]
MSSYGYRPGTIPTAIKNLLIINIIVYFGFEVLGNSFAISPSHMFGLHLFESDYFRPWQIITHMFMHGSFYHLFGNMFALFMFGRILEQVWGTKRFLIFYFVCGLGAALIHTFVLWIDYHSMNAAFTAFKNTPDPSLLSNFLSDHIGHANSWVYEFIDAWKANPDSVQYIEQGKMIFEKVITESIDVPTVGASGAIFGVLVGFGVLFPNTELLLLFPPIPIKAKYVIGVYIIFELFMAMQNSAGDNVAHFAHLGGAIIGYLLITYWRKNRKNFY